MYLDFRKDDIRLVLQVPTSSVVGDIADALSAALVALRGSHQSQNPNQIEDVFVGLESLPKPANHVSAPLTPSTIWFAKKPLPRESKLQDKFGKQERSRVTITIAPIDSVELVSTNATADTEFSVKRARADQPLDYSKMIERAAQELSKFNVLQEADKDALEQLKVHLSIEVREKLLAIFASENPRTALRAIVDSDPPLQLFAQKLLAALKKSD